MSKDVIREIKGKKVSVSVAFGSDQNGIASKQYEGVVDSGATYGDNYYIVFENGTMINMKYVQTIEVIK